MWHEARGEGNKGMELVGHVVMNRVAHNRYSNSVCSVVLQKGQFTNLKSRYSSYAVDNMEVAKQVYYRKHDITHGAIYFASHKVKTHKFLFKYKQHYFYRDKQNDSKSLRDY